MPKAKLFKGSINIEMGGTNISGTMDAVIYDAARVQFVAKAKRNKKFEIAVMTFIQIPLYVYLL